MKTKSEQIDDVIAFLESHKWIKHKMFEPNYETNHNLIKGCCVYGAFAANGYDLLMMPSSLWTKFNLWIAQQYPEYDKNTQAAVWYNDVVAKDKRYIIRKLRAFQRTL